MIEYKKVDGSFDLTGRNAIVVGGGGGIAALLRKCMPKKGANVAIVDCKDNVNEVAEELAKKYGVKTIGVKCDVTKQSDVEKYRQGSGRRL